MKSLVIGKCVYNISAMVDSHPTPDIVNNYSEIVDGPGGFVCNCGYFLGKFGFESYVAGVVGDDTFGQLLRKKLESTGVHTEYMETSFDKRSIFNVSYYKKDDKSVISSMLSKEKIYLKKTEFPMNPDLIIVDGYDYGASLQALNKNSDKVTIINATTADSEIVELAKYCKYIVADKTFAEYVSGAKIDFASPQTLITVYSGLLNKFPGKQIVINLLDKGIVYVVDNQIKLMPSLKMEIVDKNNSKDFFVAALGYALLQNYDYVKALTFASIASSYAMSKMGIDGCPEKSDVLLQFNQKYPENPAPAATFAAAPAQPATETPANPGNSGTVA